MSQETPLKYDLTLWRGNSRSGRFDMQDASGVARDVTGLTYVLRVINNRGAQVLRKASPGNGWTIPTPTNGQVFLSFTAAETRALPRGPLFYEIEERGIDGQEETRVQGEILVLSLIHI